MRLFIVPAEDVDSLLSPWLSESAISFLKLIIPEGGLSVGILSVSFLTTIWSSAKGLSSLLEGLCVVLNIPKSNFIHRRIWGIMTIIISIPVTSFLLLMLGSASRIIKQLSEEIFSESNVLSYVFQFPAIISFLVLTPLLAAVYGFVLKKVKLGQLLLFSSVISGTCIVVSMLFSSSYGLYQNMKQYTFFAVILTVMVWIRTLMLIILYGAILYRICMEKKYHPILIIKKAFFSNEF